MLELYVGNRNYSSWSMRAGVLIRQAGINCKETLVRFDLDQPESMFRRVIGALTPAGTVPVLRDGELTIGDSLAIAEYLAERHPDLDLWPGDVAARAQARSASAWMHSSFMALRQACPMNIEASLPETGGLVWRDQPAVRNDVAAIDSLWQQLLGRYGGPMLFGEFSIADAFYAPVCMRLLTYALPLSDASAAYVRRVTKLPGVASWIEDALAEADFNLGNEPYRLGR